MTESADLDQLRHTVSLQGANIKREEELLQNLMEGFRSLAEHHDQGFKALTEQFRELARKQHATSETSQPLSNFPTSGGFVQPTPAPRGPLLPPSEQYAGFGSIEDSLSTYVKVQKGTLLGDGCLGATIHRLP